MKKFFFIALFFFPTILNSQPFQKNETASSVLTNISNGCVKWVDYDLDGDFDILVSGDSGTGAFTQLFKQENGLFTPVNTALPPLIYSDVSFTDIDNDNFPDIFISGAVYTEEVLVPASYLFRNDNGTFVELPVSFPAVYAGSSCWGDLDNDGDMDFVIAGNTGEEGVAKVFRNDGNYEFTEMNTGFVGIFDGEIDLGDYDNDMDVDIVMCGFFKNAMGDSIRTLKVYRNDGDFAFTSISGQLVGMGQSNVSWWDYDSDGDLDIIANGSTDAPTYLVYIYQNLGNDNFSNIGIEIFGTVNGSVSCGDYDNDGDQDFLLTGYSSFNFQPQSVVYRNVATNLFNKDYSVVLPDVENSSSGWCDYDNSGNLDIVLSGNEMSGDKSTVVFDNKNSLINSPPTMPLNLNVEINGSEAFLSWDAATDEETESAGLTYNIRVGTTPGASQIISAMVNSENRRVIPGPGNVGHNTSLLLKNLEPGTYYFSVQSVDNGFESSAFSDESSFEVATSGNQQYQSNEHIPEILITPNPASTFANIEIVIDGINDCSIEIFDITGRFVRKLKADNVCPGRYLAVWDMKNSRGEYVESGFYTVTVSFLDKMVVSKVIVVGR